MYLIYFSNYLHLKTQAYVDFRKKINPYVKTKFTKHIIENLFPTSSRTNKTKIF